MIEVFEVFVRVSGQRQRRRARPLTLLGVDGDERLREATPEVPAISTVAGLAEFARDFWGGDFPGEQLLARIANDAEASDILGQELSRDRQFVGRVPSPLARVRPEDFGRLEAEQALINERGAGGDQLPETSVDPSRFVVGEATSNGTPDIALYVNNVAVGALVFAVDSMIVPIRADTDEITIRYHPDHGFQQHESVEAGQRVAARVGSPPRPILIWRAYVGSNTLVIDGIAEVARGGLHRLKLAFVGPSVLVGKVVFAAHRRLPGQRGDFTASRRRRSCEGADLETANTCVDILNASGPLPNVVVAVHGTMACAVDLARKLRPLVTPRDGIVHWPLVRYEHDTWLPIEANARELADRLVTLKVKRAVLVGHSRGGLVSRHAAEIAQAIQPRLSMRTVTLGTPFMGTPYAGAARTSLLGARVLLGALRLSTGAIAVDVPTRLAGLLIRGGVPRGIAAIDVGSDYLSGFAHRPPDATTTIAGDIDPNGPTNAFGLGFLQGMAVTAFEGNENDLVVSAESARGNCADTRTVVSDHFSYLCQDETLSAIAGVIADAEAERYADWLDDTDFSKGLQKDTPAPELLNTRAFKAAAKLLRQAAELGDTAEVSGPTAAESESDRADQG